MEVCQFERIGNEWVFSDGKRLPVISGGSDVGDLSFGSDGDVQESKTDEVVSGSEANGNPILNEVAPDHRSIVAPYLQKWEKHATQKFQENAAKLKPWESLGIPYEEAQQYIAVARKLKDTPDDVFRLMWKAYEDAYGDDFDENLARILQIEEDAMNEELEYEEGEEPDPDEVWRQNIEKDVTEIREWREEQAALQEQSEQQAQLDDFLETMHNQLGDFDEDIMVLMLSRHESVPEAVKAYNEVFSKNSQRTPRQVPKTMGGQGGVPNGQVDVNKLRGSDRKKAVEAFLEAAQQ